MSKTLLRHTLIKNIFDIFVDLLIFIHFHYSPKIHRKIVKIGKIVTRNKHGLVQGLQYKNVAGLSLFYGLNLPPLKKWCGHQVRHDRTEIMLKVALNTIKQTNMRVKCSSSLIKDEVLIAVGCPIFPSILIAKYLFTGSLKNRSIDNLETQKKYISMKNSQFFNYLLYAKSK